MVEVALGGRRSGLLYKGLVGGGLILMGYCGNNVISGPETDYHRFEKSAARHPEKHMQVLEHAVNSSYQMFVAGAEGKGADVSNVKGISPVVGVNQTNQAFLGIADSMHVTEGTEPTVYGARVFKSALAAELGTFVGCGTPEQSIDQVAANAAENPNLFTEYPQKKAEIINKYGGPDISSISGSSNIVDTVTGAVKGAYNTVMGWFE